MADPDDQRKDFKPNKLNDMKGKAFISIIFIGLTLTASGMLRAQSQRVDTLQILVATTEEEVFEILDRMIDSMLVSKQYINPEHDDNAFVFGWADEISSRDTLLLVKQGYDFGGGSIHERFYSPYFSNCQPIAFYGRLLEYFKTFKNIDPNGNYHLVEASTDQLLTIRQILIKLHTSDKLREEDKAEAFRLIEQATLRLIAVDRDYNRGDFDEYVTDNIRQAFIDVMENPFYPTEYLDFYMNQQRDTLYVVDTVGIADVTKEKIMKERYHLITVEEQAGDLSRYYRYLYYKELGKKWGGLSPGQAYLEERRKGFSLKGYLRVNSIAEYAHRVQDTLLIEHLLKFKEKHPDYPLKYF